MSGGISSSSSSSSNNNSSSSTTISIASNKDANNDDLLKHLDCMQEIVLNSDNSQIGLGKYHQDNSPIGGAPTTAQNILDQYSARESAMMLLQYYSVHKLRELYGDDGALFDLFARKAIIFKQESITLELLLKNYESERAIDILFQKSSGGSSELWNGLLLLVPITDEGTKAYQVCQVLNPNNKNTDTHESTKITNIKKMLIDMLTRKLNEITHKSQKAGLTTAIQTLDSSIEGSNPTPLNIKTPDGLKCIDVLKDNAIPEDANEAILEQTCGDVVELKVLALTGVRKIQFSGKGQGVVNTFITNTRNSNNPDTRWMVSSHGGVHTLTKGSETKDNKIPFSECILIPNEHYHGNGDDIGTIDDMLGVQQLEYELDTDYMKSAILNSRTTRWRPLNQMLQREVAQGSYGVYGDEKQQEKLQLTLDKAPGNKPVLENSIKFTFYSPHDQKDKIPTKAHLCSICAHLTRPKTWIITKAGKIIEVDHSLALDINTAVNGNGSAHCFFITCGHCNAPFKSDKLISFDLNDDFEKEVFDGLVTKSGLTDDHSFVEDIKRMTGPASTNKLWNVTSGINQSTDSDSDWPEIKGSFQADSPTLGGRGGMSSGNLTRDDIYQHLDNAATLSDKQRGLMKPILLDCHMRRLLMKATINTQEDFRRMGFDSGGGNPFLNDKIREVTAKCGTQAEVLGHFGVIKANNSTQTETWWWEECDKVFKRNFSLLMNSDNEDNLRIRMDIECKSIIKAKTNQWKRLATTTSELTVDAALEKIENLAKQNKNGKHGLLDSTQFISSQRRRREKEMNDSFRESGESVKWTSYINKIAERANREGENSLCALPISMEGSITSLIQKKTSDLVEKMSVGDLKGRGDLLSIVIGEQNMNFKKHVETCVNGLLEFIRGEQLSSSDMEVEYDRDEQDFFASEDTTSTELLGTTYLSHKYLKEVWGRAVESQALEDVESLPFFVGWQKDKEGKIRSPLFQLLQQFEDWRYCRDILQGGGLKKGDTKRFESSSGGSSSSAGGDDYVILSCELDDEDEILQYGENCFVLEKNSNVDPQYTRRTCCLGTKVVDEGGGAELQLCDFSDTSLIWCSVMEEIVLNLNGYYKDIIKDELKSRLDQLEEWINTFEKKVQWWIGSLESEGLTGNEYNYIIIKTYAIFSFLKYSNFNVKQFINQEIKKLKEGEKFDHHMANKMGPGATLGLSDKILQLIFGEGNDFASGLPQNRNTLIDKIMEVSTKLFDRQETEQGVYDQPTENEKNFFKRLFWLFDFLNEDILFKEMKQRKNVKGFERGLRYYMNNSSKLSAMLPYLERGRMVCEEKVKRECIRKKNEKKRSAPSSPSSSSSSFLPEVTFAAAGGPIQAGTPAPSQSGITSEFSASPNQSTTTSTTTSNLQVKKRRRSLIPSTANTSSTTSGTTGSTTSSTDSTNNDGDITMAAAQDNENSCIICGSTDNVEERYDEKQRPGGSYCQRCYANDGGRRKQTKKIKRRRKKSKKVKRKRKQKTKKIRRKRKFSIKK